MQLNEINAAELLRLAAGNDGNHGNNKQQTMTTALCNATLSIS